MSLLSAAERLAAIDRSEVVLVQDRCLHSRDRFSACAACYEICPVQAITAGKPPSLDEGTCQNCLACLVVCPTGAYQADDDVAALLKAASHLEGGTLDLLCMQHEGPELGSGAATGLRVCHCLAGLGVGSYVALAAFGFEQVRVQVDSCPTCPWGALAAEIESQIEGANQLLSAWAKPQFAVVIVERTGAVERPLWDVDSPPLSRRELFRMMAQQGRTMMARAIENGRGHTGRRPGRDRMRINAAIDHLPEAQTSTELELGVLGFATLKASEACTACGTCARVCPTEALSFVKADDESGFTLDFVACACIGCEACLRVCAPSALEIDHRPGLTDVFSQERLTLASGKLTKCRGCGVSIAVRPGDGLCPVCQYRREHPFGSKMPSALGRMSQGASQRPPS